MSDNLDLHGVFINSIVGEGAFFRGDISLGGLLRIDGDFKGNIHKADKVLIGKNGRAACSISAGTVVVGGVIKGDIVATEKVVVLSTGMVLGNIRTSRILVEEGVILNGTCAIVSDAEKEEPGEGRSAEEQGVPRYEDSGASSYRDSIERYNPVSSVE
ncbi:MAG: polymer-forming cytoskeletal protein [Spirochaetaceae bacterium]